MTKAECETTINFNDEDDFAEICTFQGNIISRLKRNKAAKKVKDIEMNGKIIDSVWHIDKRLCFPRNARTPRTLTPQEREDARKRMLLLHAKRKGRDSGKDLKQ